MVDLLGSKGCSTVVDRFINMDHQHTHHTIMTHDHHQLRLAQKGSAWVAPWMSDDDDEFGFK